MLRIPYTILLAVVLTALSACTIDTVYSCYKTADITGWEKNDTVTFDVPAMERPGRYDLQLGMRIDRQFPFRSITLVIDQTIIPASRKHATRMESDTVRLNFATADGTILGNGSAYFQYEVPLSIHPDILPGDSIHYGIRHNMKRNIIPGVSDIGLQLTYGSKYRQ